jgi:4-hydroxybenzoate polyprenyltransferase
MLFFPGWSTMLAGYFIDHKGQWLPYSGFVYDWQTLILLIGGFGMLMGSCFVFNQLQDMESDRKNRKLFLISDGILSAATARMEGILLAIISLIFGFYISFQVGIFFLFFFVLTGYAYNFKPFKMKDRPWSSLTANALMGWLAFAIGWSAKKPMEIDLLIDSLPYLLFNTALYFYTTLPDRQGDLAAHKHTLAVQYGQKKIIWLAFILFVSGLLSAIFLADRQAILFYVPAIPFFLLTIGRGKIADTLRATKYGILFFALSVCLRFPYYLVLMITGFFATRFYFKTRFHYDYPNFGGK